MNTYSESMEDLTAGKTSPSLDMEHNGITIIVIADSIYCPFYP